MKELRKKPEGLLDRLVALVDVVSAGKNLEPEKRKKKRKRPHVAQHQGDAGKKGGKAGSDSSQGKGKGPTAVGNTWAHIVKGKKVSGDAHGPIFKLRAEDWAAYRL